MAQVGAITVGAPEAAPAAGSDDQAFGSIEEALDAFGEDRDEQTEGVEPLTDGDGADEPTDEARTAALGVQSTWLDLTFFAPQKRERGVLIKSKQKLGQGVSQGYKVALRLRRLPAGQGAADGHYNLRRLCEDGQAMPQDYAQAVK
jgi:TPR repeat protein